MRNIAKSHRHIATSRAVGALLAVAADPTLAMKERPPNWA
jgi:hypothetical protein